MRQTLLMILLFGLLGCVKDKPDEAGKNLPSGRGRKVLIANEGSLGSGNASLSVYDQGNDSVYNEVFFKKNESRLGDILQSMLIVGDHLFLAMNNSDKIVVVDKDDYAYITQISVRKPREMLAVAGDKIYVGSLFYPEIHVISPITFQRTKTIPTDYPNIEGMAALNGKVYAASWDTACDFIYEIDGSADMVARKIPIGAHAPNAIMVDKLGKLWVFAGNSYEGKPSALIRIDPSTGSIEKSFTFPNEADIMKPGWNRHQDTLYFLSVNYEGDPEHNGVFRMSIESATLPKKPLIPTKPYQYFWALAIDTLHNHIYVGDPRGFIQKGKVNIYDMGGSLLKSREVGVGPGSFYFH